MLRNNEEARVVMLLHAEEESVATQQFKSQRRTFWIKCYVALAVIVILILDRFSGIFPIFSSAEWLSAGLQFSAMSKGEPCISIVKVNTD